MSPRLILEKLNLARPTIARDLILGLVVMMAVVFTLAGTINYLFSTSRDNAALFDKANEISDNLSSVRRIHSCRGDGKGHFFISVES